MLELALNTTVPILTLIGAGWLSRRMGWTRPGDERALNSYVYYFAIPAMFFSDLAEIRVDAGNLRFILAGCAPVPAAIMLFAAARRILGFSRDLERLLVVSTGFGSLAFFGIPFVRFAFPGQADHMATLSAASISAVGVACSLAVLESARTPEVSAWRHAPAVAARLARNPLILSIAGGSLLSLTGLRLPLFLERPLHMLGSTTVAVAIFLLGVFLYGRTYQDLGRAALLSLLRLVLLPGLALAAAHLLGVGGLERTVLVLMNGMPLAIAMIVLSERYDFHKETIASVLLVSSLASPLILNIWLWLVGR